MGLQQHRPEDEQRHDGSGKQNAALHPGIQQKTLRSWTAGGGLRRPRTTHLPVLPFGQLLRLQGDVHRGPLPVCPHLPGVYLDEFADCELDALVAHGLRALRDCLPNEVDLTNKNVSISVVGCKRDFTIYEDEGVDTYLELIAGEERRGGAGRDEEEAQPAAAADDAPG